MDENEGRTSVEASTWPPWVSELQDMFHVDSRDLGELAKKLGQEIPSHLHLHDLDFEIQARVIDVLSQINDAKATQPAQHESYSSLLERHSPPSPSNRPRVAVLNCAGIYQGSATQLYEACAKTAAEYPYFAFGHVSFVTGEEVAAGVLWAYDVLLVPGGDHDSMMDAITPSGQRHLREWLKRRGAYFGVCGGTYLAESLGIADIYNLGTAKGSGVHYCGAVQTTPNFANLLFPSDKELSLLPTTTTDNTHNDNTHNNNNDNISIENRLKNDKWLLENGPIIIPTPSSFPSSTNENEGRLIPLAHYAEDFCLHAVRLDKSRFHTDGTWRCWFCAQDNPAEMIKCSFESCNAVKDRPGMENLPVGKMVGCYAAVATNYGNGRIILFGTHPEKGRHHIVIAGVWWALKDFRKHHESPETGDYETPPQDAFENEGREVRRAHAGYYTYTDAPKSVKERMTMGELELDVMRLVSQLQEETAASLQHNVS